MGDFSDSWGVTCEIFSWELVYMDVWCVGAMAGGLTWGVSTVSVRAVTLPSWQLGAPSASVPRGFGRSCEDSRV